MATPDEAHTRENLLAFALGFPEAWEDHPWGESVIKVRKKVFVFAGLSQDGKLRISVKLTDSRDLAVDLEGAEPTGYGLGRSGWITIPIAAAPAPVLEDLVEESYRNVAPKRLVATLEPPRGDGRD